MPITQDQKSLGKEIQIFYFDAGGGHRSAATALQQSMANLYPYWRVTLVNLQDVLAPLDPVRRFSQYQMHDVYNGVLKRGWTFGSLLMLRALQRMIKLYAPRCRLLLQSFWQAQPAPDLVLSVIPNFNAILFQALRVVYPAVPYVTLMTDMADCPPHFWQEKQVQHLMCGTDKAMQQARALGYESHYVHRVSGMIVHPRFYQPVATPLTTPLTRAALGLDDHVPTALLMFGGYASDKAAAVVRQLGKATQPVQAIVLCGHNEKLRHALQGLRHCHAVGFTKDVPAYMQLADFLIGKPGPGSISEALKMKLPVIVECNNRTMPQERYNAEWVQEQHMGMVFKRVDELPAVLNNMLQPSRQMMMRQAIAQYDNRAVFEIPPLLEKIMNAPDTSPMG
jgi:hypothetical protein